jgi:hypothetical protein
MDTFFVLGDFEQQQASIYSDPSQRNTYTSRAREKLESLSLTFSHRYIPLLFLEVYT